MENSEIFPKMEGICCPLLQKLRAIGWSWQKMNMGHMNAQFIPWGLADLGSSLPKDIVAAESFHGFKEILNKHLKKRDLLRFAKPTNHTGLRKCCMQKESREWETIWGTDCICFC